MKPTTSLGVGNFKKLWKEQSGTELSNELATEYYDRLVKLVKWCMDQELKQRERAPP